LNPKRPEKLEARFGAFVAEQHPLAFDAIFQAFRAAVARAGGDPGRDGKAIRALRVPLASALRKSLKLALPRTLAEATPGVSAHHRRSAAVDDLVASCEDFLEREAFRVSLSDDERREMLRGMILTRAVDNRLKSFFTGNEVRYEGRSFQGKGFRSLGQEAIYASVLRLRRGESFRGEDGSWLGDVIAPMIRDLGAVLGMHPRPETARMVLNAQMGKSGPPTDGKDLHVGDFSRGILPAAAPLGISPLTIAGLAMAFAQEGSGRVAMSFVGEGATSLGEWHEAINLCAVRRLPAVFCVQNNQTALSTPVREQSAVRVFAEKARGYGIPGITEDGTDPEAVAAAFAWAVDRAREGLGPTLIELVAMRMCGHAHHDDMLYLGKDPPPSWDYPKRTDPGYANPEAYAFWSARDPIPGYAARLEASGLLASGELESWKGEAAAVVERESRAVIEAPWPDPPSAGAGVFAGEPTRAHRDPLAGDDRTDRLPLEPGPPHDPKGRTFLEAIALGLRDALRRDDRVFLYGQDIGGKYGNAFLLLRPLLEEFGGRILNSTLAEGGVLGVCVGAALGGRRPIGEIQFNDFVATGFNQLVNNAAKIRYRWGGSVPMVVRMPWGGLRSAGPYHSQNTEPWFYATPGLKIVAPSTPHDARGLLASAVADPDPVLFYEHIALYRDPAIRQALGEEPPDPIPLGRAALRRDGPDLAIVSYGAYAHLALAVADRLAADGVGTSVLDLRSLVPLDRAALLAVAHRTGRVLIVHEGARTGGIGESLAAIVQEEAFDSLDAPVRVVGALDTPVPYSPPLEAAYLPGEERVERAARRLLAY
jgi:2-oxoisovalerate dehydrogenase E1 component